MTGFWAGLTASLIAGALLGATGVALWLRLSEQSYLLNRARQRVDGTNG